MAQPSVVHPGRRSSAEAAATSERRAEIKAIAADIFARKGFQGTTVREIADAAGILSGSLYHHFDSKEAIVDEVLSELVNELMADYRAIVDAGDEPVPTLCRLVRHQFRALRRHRAAITTANNDAHHLRRLPRLAYLDESEVAFAAIWTDVLRRGVADGSLRPDLDPDLLWTFIRGAVWGTVQLTWDDDTDSDELADAYLATLLGGIVA
jgi:AcrR family transcriptional regulator